MNCPRCGGPINPNAAFCPNCGASLATVRQQPVAPTPYAPPAPVRKSNKRLIIAAIVIFLVICVAVAAINGGSGKTNDKNSTGNNDTNTQGTVTPNIVVTNENITITGNGNGNSTKFDLSKGVVILNVTSSSYIEITLHGGPTDEDTFLFGSQSSPSTPASGSRVIGVNAANYVGTVPGEHYLEVLADGSWQVVIDQPDTSSATSLPATRSGDSSSAPAPIKIPSSKGSVTFDGTYSGDKNFWLQLWTSDGLWVTDVLMDFDGSMDETKTLQVGTGLYDVPSGVIWMDVYSDGPWSVTVS